MIMHFLVAILLGLLFQHVGNDASKTISNVSFLLITALYFTYMSMIPAVLKFPLELAILKKERFNNWYQLRTYYVAMLVIAIPLNIFPTLIYSITYVLTSQPMELFRFFMFVFITVLTSFTSESIGLGLGTIFNPVNGTFFGAISVCIMLALGGFLIFFNHMSKFFYYISYMNYFRYAFDGLMQAVYGFQRETLQCPSHIDYCHLRVPSMILGELDMSKSLYWVDAFIVFIWFVIVRIAAYATLKKRLSKI